MRDVLDAIEGWRAEGHRVALATVTKVKGSAPRPPGAKMAVSDDGRWVGSVSGGCVEGAVLEEAGRVLAGEPARLVTFGITDEMVWDVGLACGGIIDVFVEPSLTMGTGGVRGTPEGCPDQSGGVREPGGVPRSIGRGSGNPRGVPR